MSDQRSDRAHPTPASDASDDPREVDRRRFLTRLAIGLGGLGTLLAGLPVIGFFFSSPDTNEIWRPVARLDELPIGETRKVSFLDPQPLAWSGYSGRSAAWLRREGESSFVAFSLYCTHTGCPVRWEEGSELFLCPCHGGAFYRDGQVAAGPPPVPLERHPVRVRDGVVEIGTIGVRVPDA